MQNYTGYLNVPQASVGLVRVTTQPPGSAGRFRFKVYKVDFDPETLPARFAIGDTVSGEAIDPYVDYDDLVTSRAAGQEIVAVVQALGVGASGTVGLVVDDPVSHTVLGSGVA